MRPRSRVPDLPPRLGSAQLRGSWWISPSRLVQQSLAVPVRPSQSRSSDTGWQSPTMALTFSIQLGLTEEACRSEDRWQDVAHRWFGSSRDNTSCAGRFDFGSLDDGVQPAD